MADVVGGLEYRYVQTDQHKLEEDTRVSSRKERGERRGEQKQSC